MAEEPVAALMEVAVRASPRSLVVGNGWPEPGSAHPEPFPFVSQAVTRCRLSQLAVDRALCSLSCCRSSNQGPMLKLHHAATD